MNAGFGLSFHPAFGGDPVRQSITTVSDDPDAQVAEVVAGHMVPYVQADAQSQEVLSNARDAACDQQSCAQDERELIAKIFRYVKSRISFTADERLAQSVEVPSQLRDLPVAEVLIRPRDMALMCSSGNCRRMEDCDGFAMYTAALLQAHGIRSSFVTVAADPEQPDRFSHVYVVAYTSDGERIAMDTSHGPYPGWEVGRYSRIEEWPVDGGGGLLPLLLLAAGTWWWFKRRGRNGRTS